jgi:hypothetical protein
MIKRRLPWENAALENTQPLSTFIIGKPAEIVHPTDVSPGWPPIGAASADQSAIGRHWNTQLAQLSSYIFSRIS